MVEIASLGFPFQMSVHWSTLKVQNNFESLFESQLENDVM